MTTRLWLRKNLLLVLTIVAVLLGTALGLLIRSREPSPSIIMLLSFPGEILMNMLKMMILPLIISSLISGLAQLDAKQSGRMGSLAISYYFATTILAVITGIIIVLSIHPGNPMIKKDLGTVTEGNQVNTFDAFLDVIRNMFPENIVQATFQQVQTKYVKVRPTLSILRKNDTKTLAALASGELDYMKPNVEYISGINVLGIIIFCIAFGITISQLGEQARIMAEFFSVLEQLIMHLVSYIMWYSPIGIMSLIIGKILSISDMSETARMLAMYMVCVMLGLVIHSLFSLPILFFICTRKNPYIFMKGLIQAWVTAIGTASSSATLPITFRCLEDNLGVDRRVTRFVLPVGAVINMDGTALYEAVAAIFIAQMNGLEMSFGQVITVRLYSGSDFLENQPLTFIFKTLMVDSLTATLAAIGAASVPSAGLVTLLLVLAAVGLPLQDVSLIVAVDWFLDRFRTSINVLGDAMGAGIVHHFVKEQFAAADAENQRRQSHNNALLLSASDGLTATSIVSGVETGKCSAQRIKLMTTLSNDEKQQPQTTVITTTNSQHHVYQAVPTSGDPHNNNSSTKSRV